MPRIVEADDDADAKLGEQRRVEARPEPPPPCNIILYYIILYYIILYYIILLHYII